MPETVLEESGSTTNEPKETTEKSQAIPESSLMKTILIAEDTDSNYILIKAILGKEYHLERAKDGMEAVNMFVELNPGYYPDGYENAEPRRTGCNKNHP